MTNGEKIFGIAAIAVAMGAAYAFGRSRKRAQLKDGDLHRFLGEPQSTDALIDSFVGYLKEKCRRQLKGVSGHAAR
jgi:hypothetical protein